MLAFFRRLFTENLGMKLLALVLALIAWFYIVRELKKGSEEDIQLLKKILPSEGVVAKRLMIKPVFVGKPRSGFEIVKEKNVVVPEYCIVVGAKGMLEKLKFIYTTPIDVKGAYKSVFKSVPLNPMAPGVYMDETLVQVTATIERIGQ